MDGLFLYFLRLRDHIGFFRSVSQRPGTSTRGIHFHDGLMHGAWLFVLHSGSCPGARLHPKLFSEFGFLLHGTSKKSADGRDPN